MLSHKNTNNLSKALTMLPSSIIYHSCYLIDLIKMFKRHKMYFLKTDKQQLRPYSRLDLFVETKRTEEYLSFIIPILIVHTFSPKQKLYFTWGQEKTSTNSLWVGKKKPVRR